jgi:hypothetical protein
VAEVHQLAQGSTQGQHALQVAILRAEAAWTAGRSAEIVDLTREEWSVSADGEDRWVVSELAWWRELGGASDEVSFELPEPFALMCDGRVREASEAWSGIGRPFWAALSLASGEPADASEAVASLLRLDAPATAQAVRRDLAARGRCRGARGARPGPTLPVSPPASSTSSACSSKDCPTRRSPLG